MEAVIEQASWAGLEHLEVDLRAYMGRRCRDESELDDVIQETYLRAARFRRSMSDPGNLRGWAMRIAGNVLRDRQRRESRMPRHGVTGSLPLEDLCDEHDDFDEDGGHGVRMGAQWVGRGEALELLSTALRRLGPDDRAVLDSFYCRGHSTAHIARDQDVPRELVKVRLFRARRRLLRCMVGPQVLVGRGGAA